MLHRLICHPDTPPSAVSSVSAHWCANDCDDVLLTFEVTGASELVVPAWISPNREDGLWRTTCFELFRRGDDRAGYIEVNLSPSGRWAAYAFDRYREGMREQPMAVSPNIETSRTDDRFILEANLDFATFPGLDARIALCAVIEEADGTKSYWALAHPPGAPDFHHPDCFALRIPAVGSS